jgi:hypothetical protein
MLDDKLGDAGMRVARADANMAGISVDAHNRRHTRGATSGAIREAAAFGIFEAQMVYFNGINFHGKCAKQVCMQA